MLHFMRNTAELWNAALNCTAIDRPGSTATAQFSSLSPGRTDSKPVTDNAFGHYVTVIYNRLKPVPTTDPGTESVKPKSCQSQQQTISQLVPSNCSMKLLIIHVNWAALLCVQASINIAQYLVIAHLSGYQLETIMQLTTKRNGTEIGK